MRYEPFKGILGKKIESFLSYFCKIQIVVIVLTVFYA